MKSITIEAQNRETTGSVEARRSRAQGIVPGVIYSKDRNISFQAPATAFKDVIYTPTQCIANVVLDGKEYRTLVKEAQFHPVTDHLMHVDLQELIPGSTIKTELPIRTVGRAIGVAAGGKLVSKMRKVNVKLKVEDLVEVIEVDVSHLAMGKFVRVADIKKKNPQFEILQQEGTPVAGVIVPRAMRGLSSAELEAEGADAGGEGDEGGEEAAES